MIEPFCTSVVPCWESYHLLQQYHPMSITESWETMVISPWVVPPLPDPAPWHQTGCQTLQYTWELIKIRGCFSSCRKDVCSVSEKTPISNYRVSWDELSWYSAMGAQVIICRTVHWRKSASVLHIEVQKQAGGLTLLTKSHVSRVHVLNPACIHLFRRVCHLTVHEPVCVSMGVGVFCSLT